MIPLTILLPSAESWPVKTAIPGYGLKSVRCMMTDSRVKLSTVSIESRQPSAPQNCPFLHTKVAQCCAHQCITLGMVEEVLPVVCQLGDCAGVAFCGGFGSSIFASAACTLEISPAATLTFCS